MFCKLLIRPFGGKHNLYGKCLINYYGSDASTPMLSVSHVKQVFRQHRLTANEGHACIIADCPLCEHVKKRSKLYINKATGYSTCEKCKHTGSWSVLEKFLSSVKSKQRLQEAEALKQTLNVQSHFEEEWKKVKDSTQNIAELPEEAYKDILNEFCLPTIKQSDFRLLNCYYDKSVHKLHFPIVGLKDTVVGCKSILPHGQGEETIPENNISGCLFYKPEKLAREKLAIIVGSIYDFLILVSENLNKTIICLPSSLQEIPDELIPVLEQYTKLIMWFGSDNNIWHVYKTFATKLGEERCYCVKPSEENPQAKNAFDMGYDIKQIIKHIIPLGDKNITTFNNIKYEVLHDLLNIKKVNGIQWKRFPTLNKILKGHRKGELTVMTGPTGCGKTTFASEYSLDLAMQGINTLWGSFEIRNTRLAKTMLQQFTGFPLEENLEQFDASATAFDLLPIFFMTFHGQQDIKIVMDTIEHATYIHNINHVIIDNLQFMLGTSEDSKHMDRYWKQDIVVSKFRTFATKANCHVTLIIHPRKERAEDDLTSASIFGGAKITQEADNILIIQDKRLCSPRGKKYLQITKNRYSGDLGIMPLDFDPAGLSHAQKKKEESADTERPKKKSKANETTVENLTGMNFEMWATNN